MKNSVSSFGGCFAAALVSVAAFSNPVHAQPAPSVTVDAPVQLPDVKVTATRDLPPLESWRYTRIEGFEVLSNASDRTTKSLMADFAQFTRALHLIWPTTAKPLASASIILCGSGGKFDEFPPPGLIKDDALVPSVFLRNREQVAIVADVETNRVAVNGAITQSSVAGVVEFEVDHYQQLYREYVHFLLSQSEVRPPAWLEEGLAQIIMDVEISEWSLIYGKINTDKGNAVVNAGETDANDPTANGDAIVGERPFNAVLQHRKLMPLGEFFAVAHDSPLASRPLGNNLWAKQAYAFVHFCLFGENLRFKEALVLYVQRITREPATEALFKECFKVGYADMEKQLRGYILHVKHKYQKYPLRPEDKLDAKSIELREATPYEVGLMKGDALRLAGRLDTATASYRDAYLRGARDPALLGAYGVAENSAGHVDRARQLLEAATKAGAPRPSAYVELARLRLAEAKAAPAANGKLDTVQMAAVLTPLFNARKNPPLLPETYELIAEAWSRSAIAPKPENLAVLDEGIRAFPRNSALLYNAAQLYSQAGASPTAASIAKLGLRFSSDPSDKSRFEQLLASLPAAKP